MAARHVALGDREQAGQAGFGREQVVIARIKRLFLDPQADVEQVPLAVVDTAEIHGHGQFTAARREHAQCGLRLTSVGANARQFAAGLRDCQQ